METNEVDIDIFLYRTVEIKLFKDIKGFYVIHESIIEGENSAQELKLKKGTNRVKIPLKHIKDFIKSLENYAEKGTIKSIKIID